MGMSYLLSDSIYMWESQNRKSLDSISSEIGIILKICLNSKGTLLAGGSKEGRIGLWDVETKVLLHEIKNHNSIISSIDIDWRDRMIVTGGFDGKIVVRELRIQLVSATG